MKCVPFPVQRIAKTGLVIKIPAIVPMGACKTLTAINAIFVKMENMAKTVILNVQVTVGLSNAPETQDHVSVVAMDFTRNVVLNNVQQIARIIAHKKREIV